MTKTKYGSLLTPVEKWGVIAGFSNGYDTLVETGSMTGETAEAMAEWYTRVYTVEIDYPSYLNCIVRLHDRPNVLPILGDSGEVLGRLCPMLGRAVWWLDAHCNDGRGIEDVPCPVLEELRHICHWQPRGNIILVDDAHLFGVEPGWPTIPEVVEKIGPWYDVEIVDNILRATPL